MEPDGNIAQISYEPKTRNIKNITFYVRNLRFKCKRCTTFCCKLGGPKLSATDVERIKQASYEEAEFLDTVQRSLKNRPDGSCVFIQSNRERDVYECSIYDSRPTLCRLFPFHFEKTSPSSLVLSLMPCRGISPRVGEPVDENFVVNHLLDP